MDRAFLRVVLLVFLLICISLVILDSFTTKFCEDFIVSLLDWVGDNPAGGTICFAMVYSVATVLFVPGSLLTVGSGFVLSKTLGMGLGMLLASTAVLLGASVGATLSFLLGRFIFRDGVISFVERTPKVKGYWAPLDSAIKKRGFYVFLLLRLSPLIPFNVLNYLAGTSAVTLRSYMGALLGIVPGTLVFVYIGATASDLSSASADNQSVLRVVFLVVGAIFGFAGVMLASHSARRELLAIQEKESEGVINAPIDTPLVEPV